MIVVRPPKKKTDSAAELAMQTLNAGTCALLRAPVAETGKYARRVFVTARHAVIERVLSDETTFSLEHYDRRMKAIAGPLRLFLSDETEARNTCLAILLAGQTKVAERIGAGPIAKGQPPDNSRYLDWVAEIVREEARAVIAVLRARDQLNRSRSKGGRDTFINFVREYCFLVTYRCSWRIFGIRSPGKASLFGKVFAIARNLGTKGKKLKLKGELGHSIAQLALYHVSLGYLFSPPKESAGTRFAARIAAQSFLKGIESDLAKPTMLPPDSLIRAIDECRKDFPQVSRTEFDNHLRSIAYELPGSMTLLVGVLASSIAGELHARGSSEQHSEWRQFIGWLRDPASANLAINEAFRLVGQTRMLRTVKSRTELDGIVLEKGDVIYLFPDIASMDPSVFHSPQQITLDPARAQSFVNFGPLQGPHRCYGQFIARTMIRELLLIADEEIEPADGSKLDEFVSLPDNFDWQFRKTVRAPAAGSAESRKGEAGQDH
jgi:hypothetical protein